MQGVFACMFGREEENDFNDAAGQGCAFVFDARRQLTCRAFSHACLDGNVVDRNRFDIRTATWPRPFRIELRAGRIAFASYLGLAMPARLYWQGQSFHLEEWFHIAEELNANSTSAVLAGTAAADESEGEASHLLVFLCLVGLGSVFGFLFLVARTLVRGQCPRRELQLRDGHDQGQPRFGHESIRSRGRMAWASTPRNRAGAR